jgi:hypothetical protein
LEDACCLVENSSKVLFWNLHQIVPPSVLQKAENASKKYKAHLHQHVVSDVRGLHSTVRFGSYVERGRSGAIWTKKQLPGFEDFLQDIDDIGKFVSNVFAKVCKEVATMVSSVPTAYKLWDTIFLMFWNATTVNKIHVDSRDIEWSIVMPFGDFKKGEIDLPYLNTTVKSKRGDLYFLYSPKVFHNVLSSIDRELYVFTNHKSVVKWFCPELK